MVQLERALCNGLIAFCTTALALQANGMLNASGWNALLMVALLTGALSFGKDYQEQLIGKKPKQKSLLLIL